MAEEQEQGTPDWVEKAQVECWVTGVYALDDIRVAEEKEAHAGPPYQRVLVQDPFPTVEHTG